ncbi:hypothetical protein BH20ACT24_BH20ACT24_21700 [soil metagenome]
MLRKGDRVTVWWGTAVECLAAVAQGERAGEYGSAQADQALARLAGLREEWHEVLPSEEIRDRAASLLIRHPLRAADALQLAAASTWARGRPRRHALATLDARLASAARGEGFDLVLRAER